METITDRGRKKWDMEELWWEIDADSWQDNDKTVQHPHKEHKALFQAAFPSRYILEKNIFFFSCFEKRLVCVFWPKQIGLLVLPRRRECIHEKKQWKGWLPSRRVNSSDWQSKDLAGQRLCIGLSLCASREKIYSVAHNWAADDVVNGLRLE